MAIDGIGLNQAAGGIGQLDAKLQKRAVPKESAGEVAAGIGALLDEAIEKLDQGQKAADATVAQLVAGEPVDLHHAMLQMEESMINLNLALQVRNKVIEAYQEVQRMQV